MAEPVGLASGLLALAAFAYKSGTKLHETIQTFRSHPRQARELLTELAALNTVLLELSQTPSIAVGVDFSALRITLEQCKHACEGFERELVKSSSQASGDQVSFGDWARFTYKSGNSIEGFKEQLIGYKSTISVALSFANLRTSTVTVESINSCRNLIETTAVDLEDHLAGILQKLETLNHCGGSGPGPDAVTIKRMEDERLSTEKGLELCAQLSQYINRIQLPYGTNEEDPLQPCDPIPTSKMLVGEGLDGCKEYINFTLQRLEKHRQNIIDRMGTEPTAAASPGDKSLLDKLQGEADTLRHCLKFCSDVDSYLEDQISNIENYAEGDDTIQIMVSTDGTRMNGKNHGIGLRLKQAGGHFDNTSLQQVSQDFATISLHRTETKKSTKEQPSPVTAAGPAPVPSEKSFRGPGFTLAPKSSVATPGSAPL